MSDEKDILKKINNFAFNSRKNILEMALAAGASSSHFGGALSIVEIVSTLFSTQIRFNKDSPNSDDRNRFILSKGHACLAYYAALCEVGFIDKEELKTFEKNDSNLLGHPVLNKSIGIDFSTGSLGIGLSIGIGLALAAKRKKKNNNTYVIIGDGECNEGSIWEGALAAPNFKLDNLFVIVDKNNHQQTGSTNEIMKTENLKDKWLSFGWNVQELNGHNINDLLNFFNKTKKDGVPNLIVANTIKGKGFSFSENNNSWHHAVMTKTIYEQGKKELADLNDN